MRLFTYYALHTFKNQLKKLMKTWLIFFLICAILGGVIGGVLAMVLDDEEEMDDPVVDWEYGEDEDGEEFDEDSFFEEAGVTASELIELVAGGVILAALLFFAVNADKNGSRIFQPADVNLLFPSPMKPQSVLMFRLSTQLGFSLLWSLYLLFQIPNLMNLGLSFWAALALLGAWGLTVVFGTLLQMLLYTLASVHPSVRRFLRPVLCGLVVLLAVGYILVYRLSGEGYLRAAVLFFNAPVTRFIPVWGWIKGLCVFAVEGSGTGLMLTLTALLLGGGLLIYVIWSLRADFYEDALAKSEETARLLEAVSSEKATGIVVRRSKDRSEKLRRDGMRHGCGANVFFYKTMYNRFRFGHLRYFTKTTEFYLFVAAAVGLILRLVSDEASFTVLALVLAGLAFFRSLGNPMAQDTKMDYFLLIPESTWAKLFWSLMGGTANCLLDVLPALLAGALIMGADLLTALLWLPLIVSMDFYATTVVTFIELSVPVSAGKMLKQIVEVLFIYFGLLPNIVVIAVGFALEAPTASFLIAALLNLGLGAIFFGLSPLFLDPGGRAGKWSGADTQVDLRTVKRHFSRLGMGAFLILLVSNIVAVLVSVAVYLIYGDGPQPSWLTWVVNFAPLYLAGVPVGLLVMRKVPAAPPEKRRLRPGKLIAAGVICFFLMYAGNILGLMVTSLLETLLGVVSENPLLSYVAADSLFFKILVMVILAPLIEEYIFRKQLIDRMNVYGEKLAVVTSGLLFGLFHGNLSQFFYAFALGLVFGYVYLRTGKLRYTVGLHMFINFMGSIVGPGLAENVDLDALGDPDALLTEIITPGLMMLLGYELLILVLFFAGLVLFIIHVRKVHFDPAPLELPRKARFRTVWLNPGMLLLVLICLASFGLMLYVA